MPLKLKGGHLRSHLSILNGPILPIILCDYESLNGSTDRCTNTHAHGLVSGEQVEGLIGRLSKQVSEWRDVNVRKRERALDSHLCETKLRVLELESEDIFCVICQTPDTWWELSILPGCAPFLHSYVKMHTCCVLPADGPLSDLTRSAGLCLHQPAGVLECLFEFVCVCVCVLPGCS